MSEDERDSIFDVTSQHFSPLDALYSEKTVLPVPSAPVLDNVAKFQSLLSQMTNPVPIDKISQREKKENEPSTSQTSTSGRRFLPHQEPVPGTKRGVTLRNVITRMRDGTGPLAFLRDCMDKRIRVKVHTRNATGIRGYCLGFVAAFDKHWNLALEDVKEVWSRKVKRKKIPLGNPQPVPVGWKAMGPMVAPPKVVILKKEKGIETCERHVNQMLMRGEHVAFISVLDKYPADLRDHR